jgi:hypothetical protein
VKFPLRFHASTHLLLPISAMRHLCAVESYPVEYHEVIIEVVSLPSGLGSLRIMVISDPNSGPQMPPS